MAELVKNDKIPKIEKNPLNNEYYKVLIETNKVLNLLKEKTKIILEEKI